MGDDLSTGAKIGIGLVILCFLIAIVLALLMVVKNITNSGASQMESGLDQMMQTTYDDFDQKVVTGTKVKSAIKMFAGQDIAIVVNSRFNAAKSSSGNDDVRDIYLYGRVLTGFNKEDYPSGYTRSNWSYKEVYPASATSYVELNNDGVSVKGAINTSKTGTDAYNLNTKPISASGTPTYVRDNAKYNALLIRDDTQTIVGIYFKQAT